MHCREVFVDIHCHLVPGIDDGSKSWEESLEMAGMASDDGIRTIIVTPHQLGAYQHVSGERIRARTRQLQQFLDDHNLPVQLLPGADVRIEPELVAQIHSGEVLTLADHGKHVLLELPHELYFPLEPVLNELKQHGIVGILSHPERNQGLLKQPEIIELLVSEGCLMQVTAGSLTGTFGAAAQQLAEWMVQNRCAHFVATDAHGPRSRRPLMRRAFQRIIELADRDLAEQLCCRNPAAIAAGDAVEVEHRPRRGRLASWFGKRRAG